MGAHLGAKMGQVGAKMALSWPTSRQDVAKMAHMEPKMGILSALLGGSWRLFLDLGGDLAKTSENAKNDECSSSWKVFGGLGGALGGYVGSSWRYVGLCWAILAPSWAILADLSLKLRPSWQDVSTKMPKMS